MHDIVACGLLVMEHQPEVLTRPVGRGSIQMGSSRGRREQLCAFGLF